MQHYSGHKSTSVCLANGQKVLSDRISYKRAPREILFYPGDIFPSCVRRRDSEYLIIRHYGNVSSKYIKFVCIFWEIQHESTKRFVINYFVINYYIIFFAMRIHVNILKVYFLIWKLEGGKINYIESINYTINVDVLDSKHVGKHSRYSDNLRFLLR